MVKKINDQGGDVVIDTPAEFLAYIKAESTKWSKVVKTPEHRCNWPLSCAASEGDGAIAARRLLLGAPGVRLRRFPAPCV